MNENEIHARVFRNGRERERERDSFGYGRLIVEQTKHVNDRHVSIKLDQPGSAMKSLIKFKLKRQIIMGRCNRLWPRE